MKVSFCITCMGRTHDLIRTLPKNLEDNPGPGIEFVLLNYNSGDGLDAWAREHLRAHVKEARVIYVHERTRKLYDSSHAKNVAHLAATGDILCNLDADNYTGPNFGSYLAEAFAGRDTRIGTFLDEQGRFVRALFTPTLEKYKGLSGRMALRRTDFQALGGYDEDFVGYGHDDIDLFRRAVASGFEILSFPSRFLIDELTQTNKERTTNMGMTTAESGCHNRSLSARNIAAGRLVANQTRNWGAGAVLRNWDDTVNFA